MRRDYGPSSVGAQIQEDLKLYYNTRAPTLVKKGNKRVSTNTEEEHVKDSLGPVLDKFTAKIYALP